MHFLFKVYIYLYITENNVTCIYLKVLFFIVMNIVIISKIPN